MMKVRDLSKSNLAIYFDKAKQKPAHSINQTQKKGHPIEVDDVEDDDEEEDNSDNYQKDNNFDEEESDDGQKFIK